MVASTGLFDIYSIRYLMYQTIKLYILFVASVQVSSLIQSLEGIHNRLQTAEDIQQVLSDEIEACTQRASQIEETVRGLEEMLKEKINVSRVQGRI